MRIATIHFETAPAGSVGSSTIVSLSPSPHTNLDVAINTLMRNEGLSSARIRSIGFVNLKAGTSRSKSGRVAAQIEALARSHGFEGVVWNDSKYMAFSSRLAEEPMPELRFQPGTEEYRASLTADFAERDLMPQTNSPKNKWFHNSFGTWGPCARTFPEPIIPEGVDPVMWKRDRIIETAKHYTGLPYKRWEDGMRGHFPDRGCGLDCSNFAAWVYNYGLGRKFNSDIDCMIRDDSIGPRVPRDAPLKKGDLVFLNTNPKHVVIYIDANHVIDSTSGRREGVGVRDVNTRESRWCRPTADNPLFLFARRPIQS